MAQPHKGDRVLVASRPPAAVYEELRSRAAREHLSLSQYVADVLAEHVGRRDLVRDRGCSNEVLPLAM